MPKPIIRLCCVIEFASGPAMNRTAFLFEGLQVAVLLACLFAALIEAVPA